MKKLIVLVCLALVLPATAHATHGGAHPEDEPNVEWRPRSMTVNGVWYPQSIPACFDPSGSDAWPTVSGQPKGKAAVDNAIGQWNTLAGDLRFYTTTTSCVDLYNDVYGNLPYVEFEVLNLASDRLAEVKRYYAYQETAPNDPVGSLENYASCTLSNRCLDRAQIALNTDYLDEVYWGTDTPPEVSCRPITCDEGAAPDVWTIVLHELGHTLVAEHCLPADCGNAPIMAGSYWTNQYVIEDWDIGVYCYHYSDDRQGLCP